MWKSFAAASENMSITTTTVVVVAVGLMGVTFARYINIYDDEGALQPIVTTSQVNRICAELCLSGLGGAGCGAPCIDITPQNLPLSLPFSSNGSEVASGPSGRRGACNILCKNQLGDPLCDCEAIPQTESDEKQSQRANFLEICAYYCVEYKYRLYGCQKCELYKTAFDKTTFNGRKVEQQHSDEMEKKNEKKVMKRGQAVVYSQTVDWDKWCQNQCASGNGGAACNCDLLPMKAPFN